jgi:hypothetical protein
MNEFLLLALVIVYLVITYVLASEALKAIGKAVATTVFPMATPKRMVTQGQNSSLFPANSLYPAVRWFPLPWRGECR